MLKIAERRSTCYLLKTKYRGWGAVPGIDGPGQGGRATGAARTKHQLDAELIDQGDVFPADDQAGDQSGGKSLGNRREPDRLILLAVLAE